MFADSGVGAGIDSYYEYLMKAYILLGDDVFLERFNIVSSPSLYARHILEVYFIVTFCIPAPHCNNIGLPLILFRCYCLN